MTPISPSQTRARAAYPNPSTLSRLPRYRRLLLGSSTDPLLLPTRMAKLTSELLRPVDPAAAPDEAALLRYLAANVPGFPGPAPALSLTQFGHGQSNPTYCIHASASAPGGGPARRYVLRKKPPGAILQSAHAVEREYQVRSGFISISPAPLFFCGLVSVPYAVRIKNDANPMC